MNNFDKMKGNMNKQLKGEKKTPKLEPQIGDGLTNNYGDLDLGGPADLEIEKKKKAKINKTKYLMYTDNVALKEVDKICNKTGYTRTELINIFIEDALQRVVIKK